ncbi:hypothetical protein ABH940_001411 [Streptacidiphilus sp. BW17]
MNTVPDVMRYIGDGSIGPVDREATAGIVARARPGWAENGYGMLSVITCDVGEYAGWGQSVVVHAITREEHLARLTPGPSLPPRPAPRR